MNESTGIHSFPTPLSSVSHHLHNPLTKLQRMAKTRFSLGEADDDEADEMHTKSRQASLPDLSKGSSNQEKEGDHNNFITYNFSDVNLSTCWEKLTLDRRIGLACLTFLFPLLLGWLIEDHSDSDEDATSSFQTLPGSVLSGIIVSCLIPFVSFAAVFGIVTYSWLRRPWSDGAVCLTLWIFLVADSYATSGVFVLSSVAVVVGLASAIHPQIFRQVGRVDLMFLVFALIRPSAVKSLVLLPRFIRSSSGLASCMLGFVLARCLDRPFVFPDISAPALLASPGSKFSQKSKRRKSTPMVPGAQTDPQMVKRRVSLPSLHSKVQQNASINLDSTLLREAQGILADMMLDPTLPDHLLSSLKAVKNIFKIEWHGGQGAGMSKRSRSQAGMMPSSPGLPPPPDAEEWPDVDRSSYKNKQRRSVGPCMIRCRSATSNWTTTTSATGLPVLEPDPGLVRSSSRGNYSSNSQAAGSIPSAGNEIVGRVGQMHGRSGSIQVTNRFPMGANMPRRSIRVIMTSDYESSGELGDQTFGENYINEEQVNRHDRQFQKSVGGDMESQKISKSILQNFSTDEETIVEDDEDLKSHLRSPREDEDDDDDYDDDDEKMEKRSRGDKQVMSCEYINDEVQSSKLLEHDLLSRWDFPIFNLSNAAPQTLLSRVAYKIFCDSGFMEAYSIPVLSFLSFFHALELGYHDNFYHNRIHATDVLHAVYYMTTQPIPGLLQSSQIRDGLKNEDDPTSGQHLKPSTIDHDNDSGVMATNFPSLELMALYTAAAMHDYDHPGRTNAFLVSTASPVAILYNDRSVLENHHVASAWCMLTSDPKHHWLSNLDTAKFKRFRFLVIEAVLATDLKRHFELVAEFNSKVNEEEAVGIDWSQEADRLMVANMLVKMADINGPCKSNLLHLAWTDRICREFYEQGDEEKNLGVAISPFMDRKNPQLAKLQESFINHLVSPLCHALSDAGLLPGSYVDGDSPEDNDNTSSGDDDSDKEENMDSSRRHVTTTLVENLKGNVKMWLKHIEAGTIPQALTMVTTPVSHDDVNNITLKILDSNEFDGDSTANNERDSSSRTNQDQNAMNNRSISTPTKIFPSCQNEVMVRQTTTSSSPSPIQSPSTPMMTSSSLKVISPCSPTKIRPVHLQPLKFSISKKSQASSSSSPTLCEEVGSITRHSSSQPESGVTSSDTTATPPDETFTIVEETEELTQFSSTENLNLEMIRTKPLRVVKSSKM